MVGDVVQNMGFSRIWHSAKFWGRLCISAVV